MKNKKYFFQKIALLFILVQVFFIGETIFAQQIIPINNATKDYSSGIYMIPQTGQYTSLDLSGKSKLIIKSGVKARFEGVIKLSDYASIILEPNSSLYVNNILHQKGKSSIKIYDQAYMCVNGEYTIAEDSYLFMYDLSVLECMYYMSVDHDNAIVYKGLNKKAYMINHHSIYGYNKVLSESERIHMYAYRGVEIQAGNAVVYGPNIEEENIGLLESLKYEILDNDMYSSEALNITDSYCDTYTYNTKLNRYYIDANHDFDGDGVSDLLDIDDDNDGIPDQDECPNDNLISKGGFNYTRADFKNPDDFRASINGNYAICVNQLFSNNDEKKEPTYTVRGHKEGWTFYDTVDWSEGQYLSFSSPIANDIWSSIKQSPEDGGGFIIFSKSPEKITNNIPTVIGETYEISFDMGLLPTYSRSKEYFGERLLFNPNISYSIISGGDVLYATPLSVSYTKNDFPLYIRPGDEELDPRWKKYKIIFKATSDKAIFELKDNDDHSVVTIDNMKWVLLNNNCTFSKNTDSDNDSCPDAFEAGTSDSSSLYTIADGSNVGINGLKDDLETFADSGILKQKINLIKPYDNTSSCADSDSDGVPDYIDMDSDNDGISDLVERGSFKAVPFDNNFLPGNTYSGKIDFKNNNVDFRMSRLGSLGHYRINAGGNVFCRLENTENKDKFKIVFNKKVDIRISNSSAYFSNFYCSITFDTSDILLSDTGLVDLDNTKLLDNNFSFSAAKGDNKWQLSAFDVREIIVTIDKKNIAEPAYFGLMFKALVDLDSDNDGILDIYDLDSDNDGIYDIVESGANLSSTDPDNNGVIDGQYFIDDNTNGIADVIEKINGEDKGIMPIYTSKKKADYLNIDSDSDGCNDANEAYADKSADYNNDGTYGGIVNSSNIDSWGRVLDASYALPANKDYNIGDRKMDYMQPSANDVEVILNPTDKRFVIIGSDISFNSEVKQTSSENDISYCWETKNKGANIWNSLDDNDIYKNTKTNTLIILNVSSDLNNNKYRLRISSLSNICQDDIFTDEAILTINYKPSIVNFKSIDKAEMRYLENYLENVIDWNAIDLNDETEGNGLSYYLSGNDSDMFTLDKNKGILKFKISPDFESHINNNIYNLLITLRDSVGETDTQSLIIRIDDEVETRNFTITLVDDAHVSENTIYNSTKPQIQGEFIGRITYHISGGKDEDLFIINPSTGEVILQAKDYESPTDSDHNNTYQVEITATDSDDNTATALQVVTVDDVDETRNFTITLVDDVHVSENTIYNSTKPQIQGEFIGSLTYHISGGKDEDLFTINPSTGEVILQAKDYESPTDSDHNNTYQVEITATDSDNNTATALQVVTVDDVDETRNFTITLVDDVHVSENIIYNSTKPQIQGEFIGDITYHISGGSDEDLFTINPSTGEVILQAKDYESPTDSDHNNTYQVEITATDSDDNTATALQVVTVDDVDETRNFTITLVDDAHVSENTIYNSTKPQIQGEFIGDITYHISGGSDEDLFTINPSTGEVILQAKDYESPTDSDHNNTYQVEITATDSDDNTATALQVVTVDDVDEIVFLAKDYILTVSEDNILSVNIFNSIKSDYSLSSDVKLLLTDFTIAGSNLHYTSGDDVVIANVGILKISTKGDLLFNPVKDYNGTVPLIQYTISDGMFTDTADLDISVLPMSDLSDDNVSTAEDITIFIDAFNNDNDIPYNGLLILDMPSHGRVFIYNSGTIDDTRDDKIIYIPSLNWSGIDDFIYKIWDGTDYYEAKVSVKVESVNDTPIANDDNISLIEDTVYYSDSVLNNDIDVDGDLLSVDVNSIVNPLHGSLDISANGIFVYTPDDNFVGNDFFEYKIYENNTPCACSAARVNIVVLEDANKAPYSTNLYIDVIAFSKHNKLGILKPRDYEGDNIIISVIDLPSSGYIYQENGSTVEIGDKLNTYQLQHLLFDADIDVPNLEFRYQLEDSAKGKSRYSVFINVEKLDLIIPDVFTPNRDGVNDVFIISNINSFPNNKLSVYNRWGNKVYEKSMYNNTWDGESNVSGLFLNKKLSVGTYFYTFDEGNGLVKRGFVELVY